MRTRALIIAMLVAAALVAAAVWFAVERQPPRELVAAGALLPGLEERLNTLERVVVRGPGNTVLVTLLRRDDAWVVEQKDGYPADTGRLRELLLALAQAGRVEAKTARPERHAALGVAELAADGADGIAVELASGDWTRTVIIGHEARGRPGSYARLVDDPQAWLVDPIPAPERRPGRWLRQQLTEIPANRISEVRIVHADGGTLTLRGEDEGRRFVLSEASADRSTDAHAAASTAGFLAGLELDDVRRADAVPEDAELLRAEFVTGGGMVVTVESWPEDGRAWARFEAHVDEALAQAAAALAASAAPAEDADPAAGQPPASAEQRIAEVRAEAEALDARLRGWAFALPEFKAENLQRPRDAYLAPAG